MGNRKDSKRGENFTGARDLSLESKERVSWKNRKE